MSSFCVALLLLDARRRPLSPTRKSVNLMSPDPISVFAKTMVGLLKKATVPIGTGM